jgi:hypothetical protein
MCMWLAFFSKCVMMDSPISSKMNFQIVFKTAWKYNFCKKTFMNNFYETFLGMIFAEFTFFSLKTLYSMMFMCLLLEKIIIVLHKNIPKCIFFDVVKRHCKNVPLNIPHVFFFWSIYNVFTLGDIHCWGTEKDDLTKK